MGNSTSSAEEHHENAIQNAYSETLGYRILGVQPNSPASQAGFVSFFDFLLGCNGRMLLDDNDEDLDFVQVLKDNIGKELELLIFNIKSQSTRLVNLTPHDDWGGHGLLGVTIRLDDYAHAEERLVRILTVTPNSPANMAGLQPEKDYLLGTATLSFSSDHVLSEVLLANEDKVIEVYVYNTETDLVRVVNLMPTLNWEGGNGLLGAEVGTGYLHGLPFHCRNSIGKSLEREVKNVRVITTSPAIAKEVEKEGKVAANATEVLVDTDAAKSEIFEKEDKKNDTDTVKKQVEEPEKVGKETEKKKKELPSLQPTKAEIKEQSIPTSKKEREEEKKSKNPPIPPPPLFTKGPLPPPPMHETTSAPMKSYTSSEAPLPPPPMMKKSSE